ncbi:cytochrome b/b6 domain-containing protein [Paraferrimonas sp. SM1919]|uniref:cytochrome b/b6 domain-containing protein n=1 Tax=Paraferrimonas sp. SM1919 TaxID=2662263 RepID=UPI0013D02B88|nr:cytochrome b/b6 domain-containing protein [Paraferrimonas sp. SM1919]
MTHAWDLPTRLFHWLNLLLLVGLWWSGENSEMDIHQLLGFSYLGLLLTRLCWGVIGSNSARFSYLTASIKELKAFIAARGNKEYLGHNPIGSLMVIAFFMVFSLQVFSGLFASDDVFVEGPLYAYASDELASTMGWLHHNLFDVIMVLAALHIVAIIAHRLKGEKLTSAMVTGTKAIADKPAYLGYKANALIALAIWLAINLPIYHYWIKPVLEGM